jgi:UDP-N-acetylglucosamine--N-acetylmuramyl-(pentapeptide) pyrophosphoryl-undecaprenol N-acetylglucosamine transferase
MANGSLRVLIAGGGTGGHIIPGLAIADAFRDHQHSYVQWVGTERGLEGRMVRDAGYALHMIEVGQLKGVSLKTRLKTLTAIPRSLVTCRRLLQELQPQVVIGVGGYASGPAMLAAILSQVPTLAIEPNAAPGLTNRLLGRWVSAAAVNFPPAAASFRNAQVTGIPVRQAFFDLPARPATAKPHLLVFGGSQGARALNRHLPRIAARLLQAVPGLTILHQAGARAGETALAAYRAEAPGLEGRWEVRPFLDDMPQRFGAADLILARSGASTVAELAAAGKPSVLVPFPQATDDHQTSNARVLADAGAAVLLPEAKLTDGLLLAELTALLCAPERLAAMAQRARTLAHPDAVERIVGMAMQLAGQRSA